MSESGRRAAISFSICSRENSVVSGARASLCCSVRLRRRAEPGYPVCEARRGRCVR